MSEPRRTPQEFDSSTVEGLKAQPKNQPDDADIDRAWRQADLDRHHFDNWASKLFVYWILAAVTLVIVGSLGVIAFYLRSQWGHLSDAVMVAWFSATVVQTIGLAYVVAHYLFPAWTKGAGRKRKRGRRW